MKRIRIAISNVNNEEKIFELSGESVGYRMEEPKAIGFSSFYADQSTLMFPTSRILYVSMEFPEGK